MEVMITNSVKIVRKWKIYHLRLIEMSSKCTKDPNKNIPLSTESRRARAQGVPIEMIIPLGKGQVDTHSNNLKQSIKNLINSI